MLVQDAVADPGVAAAPRPVVWPHATRIAFRFAFCLAFLSATHFIGFVPSYVPADAAKAALSRWIEPVGRAEFFATDVIAGLVVPPRALYPLRYAIALTAVALTLTLFWTLLDRRRTSYPRFNRWLRLYARYTLVAVCAAWI